MPLAVPPTPKTADETSPEIVELTGALSPRYELLERAEDGTVALRPDTGVQAILRRLGCMPASAEEFEPAFGDLLSGDPFPGER